VINDLNAEVITLFRILQRHYEAFMDMLRWQITSRDHFLRLHRALPETLTDLERAARFLYLQRLTFSGKVGSRSFGVSPTHPGRFDVTKLASMLEAVHERLAGVVIERLPYAQLIERYDRPTTLFYLDPPYWGCEDYYGDGMFAPADFAALATILRGLKGRFMLSLNDLPEVRQTFEGFHMTEVTVTYFANSRSNNKRAAEPLISNAG
jgi:DNA adenine methylase